MSKTKKKTTGLTRSKSVFTRASAVRGEPVSVRCLFGKGSYYALWAEDFGKKCVVQNNADKYLGQMTTLLENAKDKPRMAADIMGALATPMIALGFKDARRDLQVGLLEAKCRTAQYEKGEQNSGLENKPAALTA